MGQKRRAKNVESRRFSSSSPSPFFPIISRSFAVENDISYSLEFETHSVPLKSIAFDIEYAGSLHPPEVEEVEQRIKETLKKEEPSPDQLHSSVQSLCDSTVLDNVEQPWILPLVSTLCDNCRFGESDLLNHPFAIILIVSSDDEDPLHRFDVLSQRVLQYPAFRSGAFSKAIPFFYFLIHSGDSSSPCDDIFRNMKSTFNASQCKLIRINSLSADEKRSTTPSVLSSVPFHLLICFMRSSGCCLRLSDSDIAGMMETMHWVMMRSVLPNLAKMIRCYTQDVVNDRRGIANALFGWLRTGSSTNLTANQEEEVLYNANTIEFKIRFVADVAFLVHVVVCWCYLKIGLRNVHRIL